MLLMLPSTQFNIVGKSSMQFDGFGARSFISVESKTLQSRKKTYTYIWCNNELQHIGLAKGRHIKEQEQKKKEVKERREQEKPSNMKRQQQNTITFHIFTIFICPFITYNCYMTHDVHAIYINFGSYRAYMPHSLYTRKSISSFLSFFFCFHFEIQIQTTIVESEFVERVKNSSNIKLKPQQQHHQLPVFKWCASYSYVVTRSKGKKTPFFSCIFI